MNSFRVERCAGAIGAEISGIDLAAPMDGETMGALRAAWLEHLVLVFRDQDLDSAGFMAFARRWGEPIEYPFVKGLEGYPEIIAVRKLEHERVNFGGVWHSDTTYLPVPPMASMLLARELPPQGGDTLFASMYAAYESLSAGLRQMLDGLRGVSSSALADVSKTREDTMRGQASASGGSATVLTAEHPVARTHPETGRKALYVNRAHTARFAGWTEAESRPLLEMLFAHQISAEFCFRLRWRPGTLAIWDNRCAQHYPVNDYHGYRRLMHRITLAGTVPV
jgi:taurine dioxygenase